MADSPSNAPGEGILSSRRIGRVLAGKWTLEALLGEGGAGCVYVACGPKGELVAVKMLHKALADEPTVRTRFVREAYVANKIGHEGVVRVLEDGVDEEDVPYLVMELLEGENYEERLHRKGGKLPVSEVLWLADRTLAVLGAAHAKGIVHRDIKPENLFLTRDRKLKVLDFGIARLADQANTTTVGTVLGTLAFMPPEQARGATSEIGVQSDLWSVGATMYTLLSGKLVRDDEAVDVRKMLLEAGKTTVPSLAKICPDLPKELTELIDYALRLEIKVRWPTALVMRRALRVVHAKIRRDSERAVDENADEEVSEPSFGIIATRSLEPPPMSVAMGSEHRLALAPTPPPPADIAKAAHAANEATTTLTSAKAVERTRPTEPPAKPPTPAPPAPPPPAAPEPEPRLSREAPTVRYPKTAAVASSAKVAWLAFAAAMLAVVVLLVLLARR